MRANERTRSDGNEGEHVETEIIASQNIQNSFLWTGSNVAFYAQGMCREHGVSFNALKRSYLCRNRAWRWSVVR